MNHTQIETLDPSTSTLVLSLDCELYPRDVLYAAAYVFLDRAYILLDRENERYVVRLRGKLPLDEATMRSMAGEFENELLAQALRSRVAQANQKIIEGVTALAISGATAHSQPGYAADGMIDMENPSLDGFLDDPNGLGRPWQDGKESGE